MQKLPKGRSFVTPYQENRGYKFESEKVNNASKPITDRVTHNMDQLAPGSRFEDSAADK